MKFSFILQVAVVTATPPVTVVLSGTLTITAAFIITPISVWLPAMTGVVDLSTVPQQQLQSHIPSQVYTNYAMGPPQGEFSFSGLSPSIYFTMLVSATVFAFCFQIRCCCHFPNGVQPLGLAPLQAFEYNHGRHMCLLPMVHDISAPSTALSRGEHHTS